MYKRSVFFTMRFPLLTSLDIDIITYKSLTN